MTGTPKEPAGKPPSEDLPGGKRQIHLTGFMGSGKSTVGRRLAERLQWEFLDLDEAIIRLGGQSIAEIFAAGGEETFRRLESIALRQAVLAPKTVVALGGGTLMDPDNRAVCVEAATLVWLRCTLEVMQRRCGEASLDRPLWGSAKLEELLSAREPGYLSSDLTIDGNGNVSQVTEVLLTSLGV